ncbi:MAG: IclR family transcriptional regulator [Castellaniella sp.]
MSVIETTPTPAGTGQRIRPVPAVSRAIAILRLLGQAKEPLNAKTISDALELVPSTCLHILRVLVSENLLIVDETSKRYRLGPGMLVLARSMMDTDLFVLSAQPALDEIAEQWKVTAIGVQILGLNQMVVTALSRSQLPFRLHVDIGSRFPGLISATGRLVAAYSTVSDKALKERFERLRWEQQISFEEWRAQVSEVARRGYSIDEGQYISGVTLIAVPVMNRQQQLKHTIVTAGISDQASEKQTRALIADLRRHATNIADEIYALR